jgi:sugar phosphate isomerase/epimerase
MNISISTALAFARSEGQTGFENLDERIRLIKNAGFNNVTLWWAEEGFEKQSDQMKILEKYNVIADNAHLPYSRCNELWMPKGYDETYTNDTISDIKECSECGINTVVFHVSTSKITPVYSEVGLERIKRIVDAAEKYNVKIAFENLRMPKYLEFITSNIDSDKVGICYDSGHNNYCYPAESIIRKYKDKIFALHLHDNFGRGDEHLIPFDGNAPWDDITRSISESIYDAISLEIHKYSSYDSLTREEFLEKAFIAANKLREMTLSYK